MHFASRTDRRRPRTRDSQAQKERTRWRDLEARDAEGEFGGFFCLIQVSCVPSGAMINLDASFSSMFRARAKSRSVSPPSLCVISRSVTRL